MTGHGRRRHSPAAWALLALVAIGTGLVLAAAMPAGRPQQVMVSAVAAAERSPEPSPPPAPTTTATPSPPPSGGSAQQAGPTCPGPTKVTPTWRLWSFSQLVCEVAPGKWVKIDPKKPPPSSAAQGGEQCRGERKTITTPGAAAPEVVCEEPAGRSSPAPGSPSAPAAPQKAPTKADCGFADIPCMANEAVSGWFRELVRSAAKPVLSFLSTTVLATPEIGSAEMQRAEELWGTSQTIANTCFVLVITIAGVLLMAGQTMPREHSNKDLLPRVLLAFLGANLSLVLIGYAISFANALANAFLSAGGSRIDPDEVTRVIAEGIGTTLDTNELFLTLVTLVVVVLALILAFIYVMRLAITMVLIAAAPLALMFHALPATAGIARLWWRGMCGMLAIQVCHALVFITGLQLLFPGERHGAARQWGLTDTKADLVDLLLVICLLYVMIRIPTWVARSIWQNAQPRVFSQLIKSLLIYRTIGAIASTVGRGIKGPKPAGNGGGPRRGPGAPGRPSGPGRRPGLGPGSGPGDAGPQNRPGGSGPGGRPGGGDPAPGPRGTRFADGRTRNADRSRTGGEPRGRPGYGTRIPQPGFATYQHTRAASMTPPGTPAGPSRTRADPRTATRPAPAPVGPSRRPAMRPKPQVSRTPRRTALRLVPPRRGGRR